MTALTLKAAAAALRVSQSTLRRHIADGCPVVRHGKRGRGSAALIDPDAVRKWRQVGEREALAMELAQALPGTLAKAMEKVWTHARAFEDWQYQSGIYRRKLAGFMAATWALAACDMLERLREECPSIPDEPSEIPAYIKMLSKIAGN